MKQKVLLFARAADLAGCDRVDVELADGARVVDLRAALLTAVPGLASFSGTLFIAVNNTYADDAMVIPGESEIACFPPVSGG